MRPDSFWENGAPLAFNEARYSGMSAGIPGTPATWERALEPLRHLVARPRAPARHPRGARRLHRRPDLLSPDRAQRRLVQRHPLDGGDLPRPRRHAARRGLDAPEPRPRAHLPAAGARGSGRVLPRRAGERDGRGLAAPAQGGRRQPRLAPGPDDHRRPAPLPRDRAQARPTTATAASTSGAWARRRAAAPRSARRSTSSRATGASRADRVRALHLLLESSRFTFADRNAYLADPDFFKVPLAGLLSDSFAAERRALIDESTAATSPVAPGDPYDNQKGEGQAPPRQRHDQPPAPVHHPPGRLGHARATSSPTRSRSSRPAATRSSCPATASS